MHPAGDTADNPKPLHHLELALVDVDVEAGVKKASLHSLDDGQDLSFWSQKPRRASQLGFTNTSLASSDDSGFCFLGVCRLSGVLQHLSLPEDKISVSIMIV